MHRQTGANADVLIDSSALQQVDFHGHGGILQGTVDSPDPRLVAHAEKAIDQHFGCYPAEQNRDLEERVLNLIRWANEQP